MWRSEVFAISDCLVISEMTSIMYYGPTFYFSYRYAIIRYYNTGKYQRLISASVYPLRSHIYKCSLLWMGTVSVHVHEKFVVCVNKCCNGTVYIQVLYIIHAYVEIIYT